MLLICFYHVELKRRDRLLYCISLEKQGGYESDFFVRSVLSLALCKFSHIRKQNEGLFINIKWEASDDDDRKNRLIQVYIIKKSISLSRFCSFKIFKVIF